MNLALTFADGTPHGLEVRQFDVVDALSMPFEAAIVAVSSDHDLDFDALLGRNARFAVDKGPLGARAWTGIVVSIEALPGSPDGEGLANYQLRIAPPLWLLTQSRSHRLFQHLTTPAIVAAVLAPYELEATFRLTGEPPPVLEIRVQHGETDFAFLSRLLEEAGLSYAFEDTPKGMELVVTDEPGRAEARPGAIPVLASPSPSSAGAYLCDLSLAGETRPGAATFSDYDARRPRFGMSHEAADGGPSERRLLHEGYAPGAATVDTAGTPGEASDTPVADAKSRARINEQEGHARARRTLEALRFEARRATFTTNAVDLAPGTVFVARGSAALGESARLCVTRMSYEGSRDGTWRIGGAAAFARDPIRPPLRHSRPRLPGLESAIVVGPEGEEIHVDELGRVRVRFPWDREGHGEDHRSAWVRVDEAAAGAGFGTIAIPRVGEEVLVAFLEGDPDQPIVVGRAFNAANPPPYALPGAKTKSVWRSRSSPRGSGYSELSFEDRKGEELVLLRAERDLEALVLGDEVEETGGDRSIGIARGRAETVSREDIVHAGALHSVGMGKGASAGEDVVLSPSPTRRELIAERLTITTGGATIMLDGPDIVVSADREVRIKAGGTLSIQGAPYVHLNPPLAATGGHTEMTAGPDHVVWFQLLSKGVPLVGARCHVVHEDGSAAGSYVSDGDGMVRVPVDKPGGHSIHLGTPKKKPLTKTEAPAALPPATVKVGDTPAQPAAKAAPTRHDVPIELEILAPEPGVSFPILPGHTPSPAPSMPHVPLRARVLVHGQEVSIGKVTWELYVSGRYRVRSADGASYTQQAYKMAAGATSTKPGVEAKFELAPAHVVGGKLELNATFEGDGELAGVTARKSVTGCKVTGQNPARADVEALIVELGGDLAWAFLRIFTWESVHRLAQFATKSGGGNAPGEPLYGPPSGVGIVQRDPTQGEWRFPKNRLTQSNNFFPRIFWDWKKNVEEGVSSFKSDYMNRGLRELEALRRQSPHLPAFPEALVVRAAIRHYNGGNEYTTDGHRYLVSPSHTNNPGYVRNVLGVAEVDAAKWPVPVAAAAAAWP